MASIFQGVGFKASVPDKEIRDALESLRGQSDEIQRDALGPAAELTLGECQRASPVLTGFLVRSHFNNPADDGIGRVIGASAKYALARHEMVPRNGARWFINAVREHFPRIIAGTLKRAVDRAADRLSGRGGSGGPPTVDGGTP